MRISIATLFPELYKPFVTTSLLGRAQEAGLVSFSIKSFFDYCAPKERIDAPIFGHGAGVLIRPEVVERSVQDAENASGKAFKVFFSPQGRKLDQPALQDLHKRIKESGNHLMLLPARYEGMDTRAEQVYADEIISVGDFVLMGGDIPAMMLIEGLLRLEPEVVGKVASVEQDSFSGSDSDAFVDYPSFCAPVDWNGHVVPEIVRSGNHGAVDAWRREKAIKGSMRGHFGWVRSHIKSEDDITDAGKAMPEHYAVLMHDNIALPGGRSGTTSVTSLDVHDIARSAQTYGLEGYFLVTPLVDQKKIVNTMLDFWRSDVGIAYNKERHRAVDAVAIVDSLDLVVERLHKKHGVKPLLIGTSAREVTGVEPITFADQARVWKHDRPVVLVFGTGQGLDSSMLERCDYMLPPVRGFSDYNHLSVRSAAAIVFDRWMGINTV
jgi:tRNA (guanine37-N1)-methyltransferase